MFRRQLMAGLTVLSFFAIVANAAAKNHAVWKVPPGVRKIRVRSWSPDGEPDIDRTLNVEPGEVFRIDAIEE